MDSICETNDTSTEINIYEIIPNLNLDDIITYMSSYFTYSAVTDPDLRCFACGNINLCTGFWSRHGSEYDRVIHVFRVVTDS